MAKIKYIWWPYVREMVRRYPARMRRYERLNRVEQREAEAVKEAIRRTWRREDGKERLRLIKRLYWSHTKMTVSGAAMELYISRATAFRWSAEFLCTVAECFGIYDPE